MAALKMEGSGQVAELGLSLNVCIERAILPLQPNEWAVRKKPEQGRRKDPSAKQHQG